MSLHANTAEAVCCSCDFGGKEDNVVLILQLESFISLCMVWQGPT